MNDSTTSPQHHAEDSYVPAWLAEATALPRFEVIDTRSAQGRLDPRPKQVAVRDLILYHGHACDGLLRGAYAMRALADEAFPGVRLIAPTCSWCRRTARAWGMSPRS